MAIDLDGPNSAINVNTIETHSGSTLTIGKSGDTVSLGSGASASGFTKDGAITWDSSIKTANTSITTGAGFFVDTTSAAITITLPGSPSVGDIVGIKDYAGTFGTNNLTIARNGSNIQGVANDSSISTNRASVVLVYADATRGWLYTVESNVEDLQAIEFVAATGGTITTVGDYKIHTFTSSGTFEVTNAGNPVGSNTVDYWVLAGGGAGSGRGNRGGGGGGAGGWRESVPSPAAWSASPLANPGGALPVSVQSYPITVGSGGAGAPGEGTGTSGSPSIFSSITSAGGGNGVGGGNGTPGGSGGGPAGIDANAPSSGNVPAVSPPQGNPSGLGDTSHPGTHGGGGGGAGAAGGTKNGGNGTTTSITNSPLTKAGGGGGGGNLQPSGSGGSGGGTAGSGNPPGSGFSSSAAANSGSGSGGHSASPPTAGGTGNGGSGIVVIRYKFQ